MTPTLKEGRVVIAELGRTIWERVPHGSPSEGGRVRWTMAKARGNTGET